MKTSEIRKGNYISMRGHLGCVLGVWGDAVMVSKGLWDDARYAEGIKVENGFFLKNGYALVGGYCEFLSGRFGKVKIEIDRRHMKVWLDYDWDYGDIVYCDYLFPAPKAVHEYQNMLCACGLDELSDAVVI